MIYAYDKDTGRIEKSKNLQLANFLLKAKREKNPWDVIDLCVQAFKKKYPSKYRSYVIRLDAVKRSQKETNVGNKRFRGVSKDRVNDAYLAHTIDFPMWIHLLIRKIYDTDELILDKDFFREFGKRYPEFRIMSTV